MSRLRFTAVLAALILSASLHPAHSFAQDDTDSDADGNPAAARMQVRMNELEEQLRKLQGAMEQVNFSNRQLKAQLDKMHADMDDRLTALEKSASSGGNAGSVPGADNHAANTSPTTSDAHELSNSVQKSVPDAQTSSVPNFESSHEHYSYAFKLLNQAKYAEAGNVFSAFTQRYPKDPLIGNAFYWLGETYYVRKDYIKAADNFRQGYEAMPTGPKASDNLLKLAMALGALGKDKESCVVLKQVATKFGKTSASIKARVETEMNRIDCR